VLEASNLWNFDYLQRQIDLKSSLTINMYSGFHRQQFKNLICPIGKCSLKERFYPLNKPIDQFWSIGGITSNHGNFLG